MPLPLVAAEVDGASYNGGELSGGGLVEAGGELRLRWAGGGGGGGR